MKKLLFLVTILLLISNAYGVGLRSSSLNNDIDFVPNYEGTYYYSVVNHRNEPIDIEIYVEDDTRDGTNSNLAQYFIPSEAILEHVLPNQEPFFSVTVKLPANIVEPGYHRVHVGVRERIDPKGGFSVRTAIESLFFIRVPYEGRYLKSTFGVTGVNEQEPIPMEIYVSNLGNQKINAIYVDIEVKDDSGQVVVSKRTETISLDSQESEMIQTQVESSNIPPGAYVAEAVIHHDDGEIPHSAEFKIGTLQFSISNQTRQIIAGKINPFFVEAESGWANFISGVYADITIGNRQPVKTLTEDFTGFAIKRLQAYVDATDLKPGTYDGTIVLHYQGQDREKNVKIDVVKESVARLPSIELSMTNVLFIVIISIVVVINIVLFVILMKKKEGKNENQ